MGSTGGLVDRCLDVEEQVLDNGRVAMLLYITDALH